MNLEMPACLKGSGVVVEIIGAKRTQGYPGKENGDCLLISSFSS